MTFVKSLLMVKGYWVKLYFNTMKAIIVYNLTAYFLKCTLFTLKTRVSKVYFRYNYYRVKGDSKVDRRSIKNNIIIIHNFPGAV